APPTSHAREQIARRVVRELADGRDAIAERGQRLACARPDVDEDREEAESETGLLGTERRRPLRRHLAFAVGDEDHVAAPIARLGEAGHGRVEGLLEIRATAREHLRYLERAVDAHGVMITGVQVDGDEWGLGPGEADEAEEPSLPAGDLEQRERHGLRPQFLLPF